MIHHSLQLAHILDVAGVIKITDALCAIPGVEGVDAMSGERVIEVRYDDKLTSPRQLGAVLASSGYPERTSCCGGCGGGAHGA